jgi:hypothetical protein
LRSPGGPPDNGRGNSSELGFTLDGDFNERIDSGRAVLAGELLD